MSTFENTKLCDFTSINNNDFISTHIAPPSPTAAFYEIKPALLNLVMKEQFSGVCTDDAAAHLNNFVELCEMQKYKDVDGELCNIPDFWKVQKSENFETFCFHVKQVTKNQMRREKQIKQFIFQ